MSQWILRMAAVGLAALFLGFAGADRAWAHGLYGVQVEDRALVVHFEYSDETPAAYGEVEVYSPSDPNIEYQKGRSDQNGFYAFRPGEPGPWKLVLNDGQGHKSSVTLEVTPDFLVAAENDATASAGAENRAAAEAVPPAAKAQGPTPFKVAFGLSLILNFLFAAVLLKKSRVR